jgi:hypothetical protein
LNAKIEIASGKIVFGKPAIKRLIESQPDGVYLMRIEKPSRSLEQNRTIWMWIEVLRKHHGYTKQEMYDALIEAYSWVYTYRGLDGKPKQKKVTTSMMKVDEMQSFMESVIQHAAEENVVLPMPEDNYD